MPVKHRCICARCQRTYEDLSSYGLCNSCWDKLDSKFKELNSLSSDVKDEICSEYGVSDICHAYVLKTYGKPSYDHSYYCNRCKYEISEEEARENIETDSWNQTIIVCKSCMRDIRRENDERNRQDRKKWDSL